MTNRLYILYICTLFLLGAATPAFAQTINGNIYGGGNLSQVEGSTTINIKNGGITAEKEGDGNIYGGGYGASAVLTGNTTINVIGGSVSKDVYGGGALSDVTGSTTININGGTVTQDVYGGGALANVSENTTVNLTGGTIRNSYGGGLGSNEVAADITGNTQVNLGTLVDDGEGNLTPTGDATVNNIFGCNNTNGAPGGTVTVTVTKGTAKNNVYGGGNQAAASVSPIVNINGGTITENVYGGGYGATAVITGNPSITVTDGTISQDVYGGGALANVTGSTTININGGTVTQDVYGGGALANVSGNTSVNLNDGSIRNSYGGGLGSNEVAALVNGNATVTLGKGVGDPDPEGNYADYSASVVRGSIYGANNVNGTPEGHVKVHVLKTVASGNNHHVNYVYGGGNKAAYVPTSNDDYAEVLIENCDNSIEEVYGGGNAAPVPATKVTILGADFIQNAFAGGNGKGQHDDPAGDNYNPGADIGYLNYTRDEANKYGTGNASIEVYGGTVVNVFGGSNTWGFIRSGSDVKVQEDLDKTLCTLDVTSIFGGGNEADIDGDVNMVVDCSQGVKTLFAGASNADVNGNITLTIQSGTYENVFAGNNFGGRVNGSITLNVEEVGCQPVIIRDLYCCGNQAAYSIYGYGEAKDDGSGYRRYALLESAPEGKEPYNSPVLNIISCTRIDNVYGGGLGEPATVVGNPTVNINMVQGAFASQRTFVPAYIIDNEGKRVSNTTVTVGDILPASGLGVIGNVFGGGNAAAVKGNTTVNIATLEHALHANGSEIMIDETTIAPSANITGNVYGGGNVADVTGQTNVKIGKDK